MKGVDFSNKTVARLLRDVAAAYLLQSENQFKIIAYQNAADTIEHLNREISDIWQNGQLGEVPTLGQSIAGYLDELFRTSHVRHFTEVMGKIPAPVFELIKVPTIGPKTAFKLVNALNLKTSCNILNDVKQAAEKGRIALIETFGEKSQAEILEAISRYQHKASQAERMVLPVAFGLAADYITYLKQLLEVKRADMLGSLRRMLATIGDIDLLVQADDKDSKTIIDHFVKYPKIIKVNNAGGKKASVIIRPNIRVDLRIQNKDDYGSMLQYFTGSKTHNINLRTYALQKGCSLSEYGIKLGANQKSKIKNQNHNSNLKIYEFNTEEKFYNFLDLQYIPPEIREGTNEIELAKKNKLPKLVESTDIKGDLHTHSSYDLKPSHDLGANTFTEMVEKAKELNYDYIGFSEHNPKVSDLTSGEIVEILRKKQIEIEKLGNKAIKIFNGLEVDIQPTGDLAIPTEAINYLDYLIVSIHSSFGMSRGEQTARVMKALSYPKVRILGHPTGRLLNKREGYELDWPVIFRECASRNITIEINAYPMRLDLPDSLVRQGLEYGVKYMIDTDSHGVSDMDNMFYGAAVARRGCCQKSDIMNTLAYEDFRKWVINK